MPKTVLITGASRGIGKATAALFAQKGYNVIINYLHSKTQAEALENEIKAQNYNAVAIQADVSSPLEVTKMFEEAEHIFGKIDILVNNAGIAEQKLLTETTFAEWKKIFSVNVDSIFYCCKAALPSMIAEHRGKIINISSIWGICGASCETAYSASKAAVIGFTKALAKELGPSNIQVNCVAPGIIDTDMNADIDPQTRKELEAKTPLARFGTPKDIANSILFLASSRADFITGQTISPNGGVVI